MLIQSLLEWYGGEIFLHTVIFDKSEQFWV